MNYRTEKVVEHLCDTLVAKPKAALRDTAQADTTGGDVD